MKLLYIAGMSRSGTTILERTLRDRDNVYSVGELRRANFLLIQKYQGLENITVTENCSCGKNLAQCELWSSIPGEMNDKPSPTNSSNRTQRLLFEICSLIFPLSILRLIGKLLPFSRFHNIIHLGENYIDICHSVAKKTNSTIIVDSSKNLHHFLLLRAVAPETVKLIFVVRNGRAVANSATKPNRISNPYNNIGLTDRQTAIKHIASSWTRVNIAGRILIMLLRPSTSSIIKYEDFCNNSDIAINDLFRKMKLFKLPAANKHKSELAKTEHSIGGSPSRHSANSKVITVDNSWQKTWTDIDESSFGLIASITNYVFGYQKKS